MGCGEFVWSGYVKKAKRDKLSKAEIITAVYIIAVLVLSFVPELMGAYDIMTGETGLKNAAAAIILRGLFRLMLILPIPMIEIMLIKTKDKSAKSLYIAGSCLLVILSFFSLFGSIRTRYAEQISEISGKSAAGEPKLLAGCLSDLAKGGYKEYTVNKLYFDSQKYTTSSGRGGTSYHREYTITGYYNDTKMFKAQIGREEYNTYKTTLPQGFDICVTVYEDSGFIRSIEPSVNFCGEKIYEHMFEISVGDEKVIRTENLSALQYKNLTWCGFDKGGSVSIEFALCGINAENSAEYPYSIPEYDEFCLYAWVDGGYKRVSNIIFKEER